MITYNKSANSTYNCESHFVYKLDCSNIIWDTKEYYAFIVVVAVLLLLPPCAVYAASKDAQAKKKDKPIILKTKPTKPYRAWYAPSTMLKSPELYKGVNLMLSGVSRKVAPKLDKQGIAVLRWSYGPQSPYAKGRENPISYFMKQINPSPKKQIKFAGVGLDEWLNSNRTVQIQAPIAALGYRWGKLKWPNSFVACWVQVPTPEIVNLIKDHVIDLAVIEAYTFIPEHSKWEMSLPDILRRCQAFKKAGIINNTIVGLGFMVTKANGRIGMTKKKLHHIMTSIKMHFPKMPGIAFFSGAEITSAFKKHHENMVSLYKYANSLALELYPNKDTQKHKK